MTAPLNFWKRIPYISLERNPFAAAYRTLYGDALCYFFESRSKYCLIEPFDLDCDVTKTQFSNTIQKFFAYIMAGYINPEKVFNSYKYNLVTFLKMIEI